LLNYPRQYQRENLFSYRASRGLATSNDEDAPRVGSIDNETPDKINNRKGDGTLLAEKNAVSFKTAEQYLGIRERQRQHLIKRGALKVEGQGHNRKITVASLTAYLPPENPH
jgi:hypothetical protein